MSAAKTNDGVGVIVRGDVLVMLWKSAARLHRASWAFDQIDALTRENPKGILVLQLVLATASPPDGPTRAENHKRLKEVGPKLRRVVTVPLGDALWLSLVRTVMRGMAVISGHGKVQFVSADEPRGLDCLLEAAGPDTPSRQEIIASIEEVYRALGAARSSVADRATP